MDNRRVLSSYKNKVKGAASPYARPSNGLFSKMKLFLTGASLWSSNESPNDENNNTAPMDIEQSESSSKPFTFPEPDTTVFKTPLKSSINLSKAPNQMLSSFFQEKGDRPLTEIEYEGVVSLLVKSKSAANTPNTSVVYKGDGVSKQIESGADSTNQDNKETDTSAFKLSGSNLFVTPYSQKTLKNLSSSDHVLSTPEYKPVYHSINENFSSKNIPSVKRVYQFSGLPSPYRTRIRAPSLTSKPNTEAKTSPVISKSSSTQKETSRPMSNAANSLLSILDDNTTVSKDVDMRDSNKDSDIQQFSNPYHRPLSVKKSRGQDSNMAQLGNNSSTPTKKKSTLLSADDINKTISYDKSEELPQDKNKPISKETATNQNVSFLSSTEKFDNGNLNTDSIKSKQNIPRGGQTSDFSVSNEDINFNAAPSIYKPPVHQLPIKTNGSSFGTTIKPSSDSNPVVNNAGTNYEFKFPEIVQTEADLDYDKVEKYKHLFEF